MRDEGSIRFSQPQKRIILYDRDSDMGYLDKHAKAARFTKGRAHTLKKPLIPHLLKMNPF